MNSGAFSNNINNISVVSDNQLCTGCGACAGICGRNAVEMIENEAGFLLAKVDFGKCVDCGLCKKVCPSNPENQQISVPESFFGNYICAYVGYATCKDVRQNSQSGGVVTALLQYLISTGEIEGAYANSFNKETRRAEVVFADDEKSVLDAAGSIYTQSSVSKSVFENDRENYAAVMLGCQAESLHLALKRNAKIIPPKYVIGLACVAQNSGLNTEYLISKSKCNAENAFLRYKDKNVGGWPGETSVNDGKKTYKVSSYVRMLSKEMFQCYRCSLCYDKANVYSDIVCGDPHGVSGYDSKEGNTIILVRTERGKQLIENAVKSKAISVDELTVDAVMHSFSIENTVQKKFVSSFQYAKENGLAYPYSIENENDMTCLLDDSHRAQCDYLRKLYKATDKAVITEMLAKKEKQVMKRLGGMKRRAQRRRIKSFIRNAVRRVFK